MVQSITKTLRFFSLVFVMSLLITGANSCIKDTKCKGDIYVVRADNGAPVVNAAVHSHYGTVTDQQYTDITGRVHIELNLPCILTVDVTAPAGAPPPIAATASSTLKFEAGITNSVTIKL
jgi:hypothetical protein